MTPRSPPWIAVLVGPTAVGKTAQSIALADAWHLQTGQAVEIVSADSRQVYRGLDIGTAKPTPTERKRIPHHVIDVVEPEDDFSLADYQDLAYASIDGIVSRGALPLLVGGTGLYVRAIVDGLRLPRVSPNRELRAELEDVARRQGPLSLHERLAAHDPVAARRIDPRNVRRVIRALEVTMTSGRPFSNSEAGEPRYRATRIGLTLDREVLYRRIDERVEAQIRAGLVEETRAAIARGCNSTRPALGGFGYRQMVGYLNGQIDLSEAIQQYKFETHRFARQQYTWFRLDDPKIHWLDVDGVATDQLVRLFEAGQT